MLVMFFYPPLFLSCSLSFSNLGLTFLLCWIAGTQCWFQLCGGCFIARSMFVYGGIPQVLSARKRIPSGPAYPSVLCSSNHSRDGSDLFLKHTSVSAWAPPPKKRKKKHQHQHRATICRQQRFAMKHAKCTQGTCCTTTLGTCCRIALQ